MNFPHSFVTEDTTPTMDLSTFDAPSAISLTLSTSFSLSRKHSLAFDSGKEDYFLHLESLPSEYAAALSAPSNSILLLDKERLQPVVTFKAHDGSVTSLRSTSSFPGMGRRVLLSSGDDGSVKVWDDRIQARSPVIQCTFSAHQSIASLFKDSSWSI